jgi:hypothetical protein
MVLFALLRSSGPLYLVLLEGNIKVNDESSSEIIEALAPNRIAGP